MPNLTFNPNTYAGQAASGYISAALMQARTLQNGLVKIYPNIKKKMAVRSLDQEVKFQDASCAFNHAGTTTVGERYLSPKEMAVMYELCFADLRQSWEADLLNGGQGKEQIPADLAQYLINEMQVKIALGIEKLMWQGKTGSEFTFTEAYPGMLALLNADEDVKRLPANIGALAIQGITIAANAVVTVASTATLQTGDKVTITGANAATLVGGVAINGQTFTITVVNGTTFQLNATTTGTATGTAGNVQFVNQSNVVEVLTAVYNQVPESIKHAADFKLLIPHHIADAYRLKQASVANGAGTWFTGEKVLNFLGISLEEMPCFNANTVVAARSSNLFFGTDLLADFNQIMVVDMRNTTADQKVRFRAQFASDVNYGFAAEILLYRPA